MSTFVLVHGAWQSSGTWDRLTPLRTKHGHHVITPVLRGLGTDRGHLSPDTALSHHVEDVSRARPRFPEKVDLVGHNYAGMIISGVAETNHGQIHCLIFLDSFIPESAQCVLDLLPTETASPQ
jgi:pimeloyl-ACP methyl ester carboxylesterase